MFSRISILFMFVLMLLTTSCGVPAAAWVAPADLSPTSTKIPPPSNSESVQPSATSGDEQVYPAYYIPLATKVEIAPQTMNGATVRLDATSVQISSTMAESMGAGAYGGSSLPVDRGVTMGSFDQLLIDGTLNADEHPNIALDVDIPVNGTTVMRPLEPVSGQQPAPQENVSLPDIGD